MSEFISDLSQHLSCDLQILGIKDRPSDENKEKADVVGEYFCEMHRWLDDYFGGLRSCDDWEKFYVHLAGEVVKNANAGKKKVDKIDLKQVIMPPVRDLFQACRLMYQSLGMLRNAIPDGQHRMAAMLELLTGWKVGVEPRRIPVMGFVRGDHHGMVQGDGEDDLKVKFDAILKTIVGMGSKNNQAGTVTVRILRPGDNQNMEEIGEKYSKIREESQSLHEPRNLIDV